MEVSKKRKKGPNNAIHQQNRACQTRRLTKTLFVSAAAVFSWFPHNIHLMEAHMVSVPVTSFLHLYILYYSNSFVNPVIYAFKILEFRQSLIEVCSKRRADASLTKYHLNKQRKKIITIVSLFQNGDKF